MYLVREMVLVIIDDVMIMTEDGYVVVHAG